MKKYISIIVLLLSLTPCLTFAQGGILLPYSELGNAQVYTLVEALEKPEEVNVLDLCNTKVTEIPEGTFFKNLQALYLAKSPSPLADWINVLSVSYNPENIIILDISNNNLKSLPDGIAILTNLISLNMSGNPDLIKEVDASTPKLLNLEILDISNNNLTTIPGFINKFALLKEINLSNNLMLVKELDKCDPKLAAVEKLNFSNNKLTTIIDWLAELKAGGSLSNLKELNLEGNSIKAEEIEKLKFILPDGTKITTD